MLNILFSIGVFAGVLLSLEIGRFIGLRRNAQDPAGTAAVDSVVFAVLGLLVAFTFTASASRFDERRRLIIEQANAVGTAWLRVDLLPQADRAPVRALMKRWVEHSLVASQSPSGDSQTAALNEALALQSDIWNLVIASYERDPRLPVATHLLPALNSWFDLSTLRLELRRLRVPLLVMATLIGLSFTASVLVGFEISRKPRRSIVHLLLFAGTIAFSLFVIVDLSDPREGLIQMSETDQVMHDLLRSFDAPGTRPAVYSPIGQTPPAG
jgi:hypothetical protein